MNVNSFSGNPVLEMLPDGRNMKLLEDFSFADTERIWTAPAGCVINGISIPRPLWVLMGSPYVGKGRYAAVLHDYYCQIRQDPYVDIHRMFYNACIIAGVPMAKAGLMYEALLHFGIRWDDDGNLIEVELDDDDLFPLELTGHLE